jgi:hypothetical protein
MVHRFLLWIGFALCTLPLLAAVGSSPCAADSSARQLDFWLGDWSVGTTEAPNTGHSKVSLALDGCLVSETWASDGTDHKGENVMAYNRDDKTWRGLFIDNRGRVHALRGVVTAMAVEFQGPSRDESGKMILTKVKIVRLSHDHVEQIWQKSSDNGASWTTDVRMQYARKKPN